MITHAPYEPPVWLTRVFDRLFPKPPPEAPPPPRPEPQATGLTPELLAYMIQTPAKPVAQVRTHVFTRLEAERDLVTRLAFGETIASQDDLAARWSVDKSTVSKWLKRWERKRLIPKRKAVGRFKVLTKA